MCTCCLASKVNWPPLTKQPVNVQQGRWASYTYIGNECISIHTVNQHVHMCQVRWPRSTIAFCVSLFALRTSRFEFVFSQSALGTWHFAVICASRSRFAVRGLAVRVFADCTSPSFVLRVRGSHFAVRTSQFALRSSHFAVRTALRSSRFALRGLHFAVRSSHLVRQFAFSQSSFVLPSGSRFASDLRMRTPARDHVISTRELAVARVQCQCAVCIFL